MGEGVDGSMDDAAVVGRVAEVALCCWLGREPPGRRWHACNFWLLVPVDQPCPFFACTSPLQKWHPDKNTGNEEAKVMFQKISEAYTGEVFFLSFLFLFLWRCFVVLANRPPPL